MFLGFACSQWSVDREVAVELFAAKILEENLYTFIGACCLPLYAMQILMTCFSYANWSSSLLLF